MLHIKEQQAQGAAGHAWIGPAPWINVPPPGPRAQNLLELDRRLGSPSYLRDYPLVVRRGHGSVVEDVDGNRYLDFAASLAVCSTGHTHPKVVAAIQHQASELIHTSGATFCHQPMVALTEKLAALAPGKSPKGVLLTNSGSEAAEAAFKLVRYHTGRPWVIAFHGASHGRTMGALSLSFDQASQRDRVGPLVPMVAHVPFGDLEAIKERVFEQLAAPEQVAAIFVEPIQGQAGCVVPSKSFLSGLRSMCDRHGMLLVADEVQSGMGRTGKMFACQHFALVPDVILCAKGLASGLPLGAVVANESVMDWPAGAQASSFGGNPICCAAALATLQALESGMIANAAQLGEVLLAGLVRLVARRKGLANARGLGLMAALDVVHRKSGRPDPQKRRRILDQAFRSGLILLPCGPCGIRFCPPLCINRTQLTVGLDVLDEVVATLSA
ncbi:MAG: aminotransferase class III-fold pyridoxal phosphate-dependent enzyme [Phycisphaerae bacterium]